MSASTDVVATNGAAESRDTGLLKVRASERRKKDRETSPLKRFFGSRPEPRPSALGVLEPPTRSKTGICCSGGGIRSAAYNLGALQSMQKHGTLARSEYVSAVSGGSYIAASFFMVARTRDEDTDSDPELLDAKHPPFHHTSPEEQYLRNRSSYMAPDGLAKLFLGFRVLMGLAFNLFFLGLPVFALGIVLAEVLYGPGYGPLLLSCAPGATDCDAIADVPQGAWIASSVVGALAVTAGVFNLLLRFRHDVIRTVMERLAVTFLLVLVGFALVLVGIPVLIAAVFGTAEAAPTVADTAQALEAPAAGGAGLGALLVGALALARERFSRAVETDEVNTGFKRLRKLPGQLRLGVAYVVGALVGPAIFLLIAAYGAAVTLSDEGGEMVAIAVGAVAVFAAIYAVADLNTWSLHPLYRRRLCTAFALRRVGTKEQPEAEERSFDTLVPLSESAVTPPAGNASWPTLLVCAAANVSDVGATPPGRGVTSFTFSATAIGGPLVGGAPTKEFEGALGANRRRDITLPAAVAMSGAALAPSMGKLTRKPFTFLLALANIRLGVWVPNPRYVEEWKQREPLGPLQRGLRSLRARLPWNGDRVRDPRDFWRVPRPHYLLRELLGRNRVDAPFLYVSDGGHYDNLGLVELLRRGCTEVYCFDASGGTTAKDLGDAIALARSELGVEIKFEHDLRKQLYEAGTPPLAANCCVKGTITYPDSAGGETRRGHLVYASTVMTEKLPWDVAAFREGDPEFPHHSTIDQLYTDQKFEAYRALGLHAGEAALTVMAADEDDGSESGKPADGASELTPMPVVTRFEGIVQERITRFRRQPGSRH